MGDWRGDHYKTSDEANACGWLRQIFVREAGNELWMGQALPREWLKDGQTCGIERAATYFGVASVVYTGSRDEITARIEGPRRNPPSSMRLRFREASGRAIRSATVNGSSWTKFKDEWVILPGDIGAATITVRFTGK